jgi:hypothetical protein
MDTIGSTIRVGQKIPKEVIQRAKKAVKEKPHFWSAGSQKTLDLLSTIVYYLY